MAQVAAAATALPEVAVVVDQVGGGRAETKWVCGAGGCAAQARIGAVAVGLRAVGEEISVDATFETDAWVGRVAVELTLPGTAQALGRDLRRWVAPPIELGRFDPKWISVGAATVVVDDGVDGVRLAKVGAATKLLVELLDVAERPFRHDTRCTTRWRDRNPRIPLATRFYVRGEKLAAQVRLLAGHPVPLVQSRWPSGRAAALVITDHADQSTLSTFSALVDALARRRLVLTKALFAVGGKARPQLELPAMVALADQLAGIGGEVVPHSATPSPDQAATTEDALGLFDRWRPRSYIDHQPETNCEAFNNEGWRMGGRWDLASRLAKHGYEYIWAEGDDPPGPLDMLGRPTGAAWLYPLGRLEVGGPELWMWRSMWGFLDAGGFYAMYAPAKLDALEDARGLHVAHTYLETYHAPGTRFGQRNLFVPVGKARPGKPGPVRLAPRFASLLDELAARQERGTLWVTTMGALGERVRASLGLRLRPRAGGWVITVPVAVAGATFVLGEAAPHLTVDGKAPAGLRIEPAGTGWQTVFWADLPSGEAVVRLGGADQ